MYTNPMDQGLSIRDIGTTSAPMKDQLEELKAKIRLGVSKVELGFWGAGKGSSQSPTPGTYGKDERTAIRELAQINEVELTTHATPIGITGVSGIDPRGQYSEEIRKTATDEIKRAVDFASEVAHGGAVVFHLGEHQRPIIEGGIENGDKLDIRDGNPLFVEHEDAKNKAFMSIIDTQSGKIIQNQIPMNQKFREPVVDENNHIQVYSESDKNSNGKIFDNEGNEYFVGDPKLRTYTWKDIIKETKEHNKKISNGESDNRYDSLGDFSNKELTPTEIFQIKQLQNQVLQLKGNEGYYQERLEGVNHQLELTSNENEKRKLQTLKNSFLEGISQSKTRELDIKEQMNHIQDLEKFSLEKTAKSIAELGIYSMQKQKEEERKMGSDFKRDLFIAPENVFPEQFGGHPEEMIRIIKEGRKAMADKLIKEKGFNNFTAEKEAEKHIKGTFDIAHANLWKKYFTGSEKEYWNWYSKQVKNLQDANVLGHIHITDNLGYGDEHLAPGQGNLPIKELIEKFKKSDVDFVVEPGWKGDSAIIESFKEFSSPIYGLSRQGQGDPWVDIDSSYFGRTAPPYFIVGEYGQQMGERVNKDFSSFAGIPFE